MKNRAMRTLSLIAGGLLSYTSFISPLYANPQDATVINGAVSISQPDAKTVQIQQTSDKAIVNWQSFNIAAGEHTQFIQPGSNSIILNRVVGADPSKIFGQLSANGKVVLVNPAGIYFGAGAHVNVASLVATTADIKNEDFLAGNYHFIQASDKATSVINAGEIQAAEGLVALVAPAVANSGVIQANLGKVVLASGNEYTVDLQGDQVINFVVSNKVTKAALDQEGKTMQDAVSNTGTIIADGGTVLMTAHVAQDVVQNVINMEGVIQANSVAQHNGEIILSGGEAGLVRVAGKIDASSHTAGQKGGNVKITGQAILLDSGADINASGNAGGGEVLVGGDYQGTGDLPHAQWLYMHKDAAITADALETGDGGKVVLWSDGATGFFGNISARGSQTGNGGFVETSGHWVVLQGKVDASALSGQKGTWLIDPRNVTIDAGDGLAAMDSEPFDGGTRYFPSGPGTSAIGADLITTELNSNNNVYIITQESPADGGMDPGDINVTSDIIANQATTATLFLNAQHDITISSGVNITISGSGGLNLQAANDITVNGNLNNTVLTANATHNVAINTNTLQGTVTAGGNASLFAINGMIVSVNITGGLSVGGNNGGTITGFIRGAGPSNAQLSANNTSLLANAQGSFTVNGIEINNGGYNIAALIPTNNNEDDTLNLNTNTLTNDAMNSLIEINDDAILVLAAKGICA